MLTEVIALVLVYVLIAAFALQMGAESVPGISSRNSKVVDATAAFSVLLMLALLGTRSLEFGVDTNAYADLFRGYCNGQSVRELSFSYALSLLLLDGATAGACRVEFLPGAWAIVVTALLMATKGSLSQRLRLTGIVLLSMIGLELVTNSLRQGFAAAFVAIAVSYWPRYRIMALLAALMACAFHTSSLLVLMALALSLLPWRWYLAGGLAISYAVFSSLDDPGMLAFAAPLLYEITKYMGHEDSEIYVRMLVVMSVAGTVILAFLATRRADRGEQERNVDFGTATKLALSALPLLVLPYFGYRYLYGIYPALVVLLLRGVQEVGGRKERFVVHVVLFNLLVLGIWSSGSTYMREVKFTTW